MIFELLLEALADFVPDEVATKAFRQGFSLANEMRTCLEAKFQIQLEGQSP